jgi:hypothetical protein
MDVDRNAAAIVHDRDELSLCRVTSIWSQNPASASSIELSTTS